MVRDAVPRGIFLALVQGNLAGPMGCGCDFIQDKAKRMLAKYEAVSKEKKVMQEEKSYYFQRKVDALNTELKLAKLSVKFADRVIDGVVPRL